MRLVDADKLIGYLNDYALSESPAHNGDDDSAYKAIMNCIETIEDAETMTDTNVVRLIFDQDGTAHGYDEKYTVSILHETAEEMEDTKQLLKNLPRWVPVSERLPDDYEEVVVTFINTNPAPYYNHIKGVPQLGFAVYYDENWYWWSPIEVNLLKEYGDREGISQKVDKDIVVIAWQSLPEAYKEEVTDAD